MRAGSVCLLTVAIMTGCATAPAQPAPKSAASQPATAAPAPAPAPAPQVGGLLFDVQPKQAELFVGSSRIGRVGDLDSSSGFLKLDPGIYQVSLKLAGYATWRAEVTVREGQAEKIQVSMVAK
jgi:hypothetical protein